jgi:hypothetical protein
MGWDWRVFNRAKKSTLLAWVRLPGVRERLAAAQQAALKLASPDSGWIDGWIGKLRPRRMVRA